MIHPTTRFLILSLLWLTVGFVSLNRPLPAQERPNVLLICIDDLRPELRCFGTPYIHSPQIDRLAQRGRVFTRHYVQAPTCGASRYALLTGQYGPAGNEALFQRAQRQQTDATLVSPSLPMWFREHGYRTVSIGKVSHHPGGRGGPDWDDDTILEMPDAWDRHEMPAGDWRHPRGAMHGLAHGQIRGKVEEMAVFQSVEGPDSIYPDGLITEEARRQLETLTSPDTNQPFFLAVGLIRPHLPFGAPQAYLDLYRDTELPPIPHPFRPTGKTTWHGSGEFMKYQRWGRDPNTDPEFANQVRRHYAACVSYADAQVGKILDQLHACNADQNTIVVLWGDHGWHLGEHAIWGKHSLFEESLRSPLIIASPGLRQPGQATSSIVETIDLYPTLCELASLPIPSFLDGISLVPQLQNPASPGHDAISYSNAKTIRTETHRLIEHRDGHLELYDHRTPDGETRNIASDHPDLVKELRERLKARLDR